jgi:transcription termination factor NusB
MIETIEQLGQAIEQMGRMQRILESYRTEVLVQNPRNFAMLAEGPLEQLRQLQAQVEEYVQQWETAGSAVKPNACKLNI